MMRAKIMKAIIMMVRLNIEIKVPLWLLLSLVDDHHDNDIDDESNETKRLRFSPTSSCSW